MTTSAFLTFTVSGGRKDRIRLDLIGEVLEEKSSSVPFDTVGSRLILTTGREVSVTEEPDRVMMMVGHAREILQWGDPQD